MTFTDFGASKRGAAIPEHNRLRGVEHAVTRPAGLADPHPSKADADHAHSAAPLGVLGWTTASAASFGTGGATLMSVDVAVDGGRLVKVTGSHMLYNGGVTMAIVGRVFVNAVDTARYFQVNDMDAALNTLVCGGIVLLELAAGAHTVALHGTTTAGTCSIDTSTHPAFLLVEDLGVAP